MTAFVKYNIAVKKQQHRFILIIFTLRDLPLYKEFLKVMWHLEIQWTWNTVHLILSESREFLSWRLIYNLVSCLFYQLRLLRRKWCTGGSCWWVQERCRSGPFPYRSHYISNDLCLHPPSDSSNAWPKQTELTCVLTSRYAEVSCCSSILLIEFTHRSLFYSFFVNWVCNQIKHIKHSLFASLVGTESLV